ncbi:MAG TPA: extracellular solute-binding protein, partial [Actinomycetota bacterium]|nr:extracellular solute-binding protein [Actinomycetota bacterium]
MRKRHLLVATAAALSLVAAACGGAPETPGGPGDEGDLSGAEITFNVSLAEEEQAGVQAVLDQFTQQTGANVKLSSVTADQMPQKLQVEVESGNNTIHLISQDNYILEPLVADGLVQDVGDVEIPAEVSEALIPAQFDGTTYFLPFRPNVRVAYANTQRFEEAGVSGPPTTHEEWRSMAEAFAQTAGEPKVTISFAEGSSTGVVASEWILSFGGNPLILNDEGSVAAFEFLQDAWNDG